MTPNEESRSSLTHHARGLQISDCAPVTSGAAPPRVAVRASPFAGCHVTVDFSEWSHG